MATRLTTAVTALLDANKHPLRKAIKTLRSFILTAERSVEEGVRWKAESFPTSEWFATLNDPKQVKEAMNILHRRAKVKGLVLRDRVAEPHGLITWLGKDRGMTTFRTAAEINSKAQQPIVRACSYSLSTFIITPTPELITTTGVPTAVIHLVISGRKMPKHIGPCDLRGLAGIGLSRPATGRADVLLPPPPTI